MKHAVIIGLVLPEPASTAAGNRMLQVIRLFKEWNYKVSFLSAASPSDFSERMDFISISLNDSQFDEELKKLNPDIVLFDRYITEEQFGWRVAENCPNAIRILDTEDLHFLRQARKIAYSAKRKFDDDDLYNDIFKREIASILRCDLSLLISKYEYQLLTEKFRIQPELLFYIPFLFENKVPESPDFSQRKHFMSIGNFFHEPNWQTVLKLKLIWKNIKSKLPDVELHIYGAYPSEKVYQLNNEKEGFIVKGRANSVEDVFSKYKVLLAPIPFGAGLKGKLYESMLYGLPNVTSSIGAEAMQGTSGWNGFIEDDELNFIEKSVQLYSQSEIWESSKQKGYEILNENFSATFFKKKLRDTVSELEKHLKEHRKRNYLGPILSQQSLNATKYMSKWIEEKNKEKS